MRHDDLLLSLRGETPRRRQDVEPVYRAGGCVDVASAKTLLSGHGFVGPTTPGCSMPAERSVSIDRAADPVAARASNTSAAPSSIRVGDRTVGVGSACFVIAEAGVNHNGDFGLAKALVDAAAYAGADAVKFQTFKSHKVIAADAPKAQYQKARGAPAESQLDMVKRLELSFDQHEQLAAYCQEVGIVYLSSPFDDESLDLLCRLRVPAIKVGSGELTHHDFLARIAGTGLPVLLSTGMSTLREVDQAVEVLVDHGVTALALLHCVSSYPTAPHEANLSAMDTLREAFRVPVGWSDHTDGIHVALAAVARGANLLEKHLTVDRKLPGPDHAASLEPEEFKRMLESARAIELAIGDGIKVCQTGERNTREVARRSVHTSADLKEGHHLMREDLELLRPGTGIPADRVSEVIGRVLARDLRKGAIITPEDLQ